jgi:hypothetical protein
LQLCSAISIGSPTKHKPQKADGRASRPGLYRLNLGRVDVAKGQLRSNREKKKPKADKNKVKAAPAASPFASPRVPGTHPRGKGGKASS